MDTGLWNVKFSLNRWIFRAFLDRPGTALRIRIIVNWRSVLPLALRRSNGSVLPSSRSPICRSMVRLEGPGNYHNDRRHFRPIGHGSGSNYRTILNRCSLWNSHPCHHHECRLPTLFLRTRTTSQTADILRFSHISASIPNIPRGIWTS